MSLTGSDARPLVGARERSAGVGEFRWDTTTDVWWWSDGLYRLLGYEPLAVEPSMDRFLHHKDPRDRAKVEAVFDQCLAEGGAFSCYHHIIDAQSRRRTVVAVGQGDRDTADTRTVAINGFLVDVTASGRQETNAALQAALQHRAGIEQVKGILMLVHGLDPDAAFGVLRGHSQLYNAKVSAIVVELLKLIGERGGMQAITRSGVDRMLQDAAVKAAGWRTGAGGEDP